MAREHSSAQSHPARTPRAAPPLAPSDSHPAPSIVVLSGSDRTPVKLPDTGRSLHPLSGYKGVDLRIGGVPIVRRVVDRLRVSGRFAEVYVAGPAGVHANIELDAELIDADGSIGHNIKVAVNAVAAKHPGCAVAFIVCDVLPDVDSLRAIMDIYRANMPCDIFYPLVKVPEEKRALGASGWKPTYAVAAEEGAEPQTVLPGHLVIADPDALRLNFVYRLLNLTYRTRNRSLHHRRNVMIRGLIFELLFADLRHLLNLRPPTVTVSVIATGLRVAVGLLNRTISCSEIERRGRKIFVNSRHRRMYPDRKVVVPLVDGLALAMDIDTEEEARYAGAEMGSSTRPDPPAMP